MTDVALCGRALGTWRPRRARRGLFLGLGERAFELLEGKLELVGMELLGLLPVQRPAQLVQQMFETAVRSLSAATSARSASRAACCPSNNTRKGGASDPGSTMPVLVSMTEYYHEIRHLVNKIRDRQPPLRHAAASGRRTRGRHTRRQSRPSNNASNCARESRITPSRTDGQAKRPCSRRFDASTRPVPSHHRTLIRSRRLGRNTTTHAGKGIQAELVLDQRRQGVMPLAKVHRTRRHHDPWRRTRNNHRRARSAAAISAIRKAPISRQGVPSRRAPRSTPNRPNPDPASPPPQARRKRARTWMRQRSARPRPCGAAKVRAAGAAGSSSVAGEDGEVSLPRRARARQAFT